jgi:hypothetical protein
MIAGSARIRSRASTHPPSAAVIDHLRGEDALGDEVALPDDELTSTDRLVARDVVDRHICPTGPVELVDGRARPPGVPRVRVVPVDDADVEPGRPASTPSR